VKVNRTTAGAAVALLLALLVITVYAATISVDFDTVTLESVGGSKTSQVEIIDIDGDGDNEAVFYRSGATSRGGAIEVPVNVSLANTTISFTAQFASPDGIYVFVVDRSMISYIENSPDIGWEDSFQSADVYGYQIAFDVYDSVVKVRYRDANGEYDVVSASYTIQTGIPVAVGIYIAGSNLTVRIGEIDVLAGVALPDVGGTLQYLVVGARVGGYSADADSWIDDLVISVADGDAASEPEPAPEPPSETATETVTVTGTVTETVTARVTETATIANWFESVKSNKVLVIGAGLFILVLLLALASGALRRR